MTGSTRCECCGAAIDSDEAHPLDYVPGWGMIYACDECWEARGEKHDDYDPAFDESLYPSAEFWEAEEEQPV